MNCTLSPNIPSRTSLNAFFENKSDSAESPSLRLIFIPFSNFFTVFSPRSEIVRIACSYTFSQKSGTAKMWVTLWRFIVLSIVCGCISFRRTNVREKNANQM